MPDVRWTTSDRGFRFYAPVGGHEVRESSMASAPHLWVDNAHLTVDQAAELRDTLPAGLWRDTLTAAIDGHYQTRPSVRETWQAGDPCEMCGSTDTALVDGLASCNGCGADETEEAGT